MERLSCCYSFHRCYRRCRCYRCLPCTRAQLNECHRRDRRWDLAQVLMIAYVGTLIPYREAFDVTVETGSAAFWLDVLVDLYFIMVS